MILVSIGANLPAGPGVSPLETCRAAAVRLDALPGLRLRALSRWFLTAPVPPSDQPDYVNAVAVLQVESGVVEPDPASLLANLQQIETAAGRVRGAPNAPRTLDLDIIAMGAAGQLVRAAPDPVVPHPRAHQRGFVLVPLIDVAPGWLHPLVGRNPADLLAGLPPQAVRPLDPRGY